MDFARIHQTLVAKYPTLAIGVDSEINGDMLVCVYTGTDKAKDKRMSLTCTTKLSGSLSLIVFNLCIYKNGVRLEQRYENGDPQDAKKILSNLLPKTIK